MTTIGMNSDGTLQQLIVKVGDPVLYYGNEAKVLALSTNRFGDQTKIKIEFKWWWGTRTEWVNNYELNYIKAEGTHEKEPLV